MRSVLDCEIAAPNAISEEPVRRSPNAPPNKILPDPWWVETWEMRVWNISVALKWILMYSPDYCKSFDFCKQLCWRTLFWCRIIQPWTVAINLFNELRDLVFVYIPAWEIYNQDFLSLIMPWISESLDFIQQFLTIVLGLIRTVVSSHHRRCYWRTAFNSDTHPPGVKEGFIRRSIQTSPKQLLVNSIQHRNFTENKSHRKRAPRNSCFNNSRGNYPSFFVTWCEMTSLFRTSMYSFPWCKMQNESCAFLELGLVVQLKE